MYTMCVVVGRNTDGGSRRMTHVYNVCCCWKEYRWRISEDESLVLLQMMALVELTMK